MNNENFLDELYGSEQNPSKIPLVMGTIFSIIAFFGIVVIANVKVDIVSNIFLWYITIIFLAVAFFVFVVYFFQNAKGKNQYKKVKHTFIVLSLLILAIAFLPVTIVTFLSHSIKFKYLIAYPTVYIVSIFIPMLISILFIWPVVYIKSSTVPLLNASTIAALSAFLSWQYGSLLILKLFRKKGKKLNDEVFWSIKKDLYVVVFVMITTVTIIANCINFSETYSSVVKGFTGAFAIYIACDRLLGKWNKANEDYEKGKVEISSK